MIVATTTDSYASAVMICKFNEKGEGNATALKTLFDKRRLTDIERNESLAFTFLKCQTIVAGT
jgi:hypothetical protein